MKLEDILTGQEILTLKQRGILELLGKIVNGLTEGRPVRSTGIQSTQLIKLGKGNTELARDIRRRSRSA